MTLKEYRESKGLSDKEVAREAKISLPCYRNLESGRSKPYLETKIAVARAFGLSLFVLHKRFFDEEEKRCLR